VLIALGRVTPGLEVPAPDDRPALQLQLLRPSPANGPRGVLTLRQAQPKAVPAAPVETRVQVQAQANAKAAAPDHPGFFEGAQPGCGLEDIALLTADERVRCRNQIEAARARRTTALDDAGRADRIAAMRRLPKVDGISPEKRAYYDAVEAATASKSDFHIWDRMQQGGNTKESLADFKIVKPDIHDVVTCSMKFGPTRASRPARVMGRNWGPSPARCPPPTGFLTEEARISPP
jgi:hypothetical protein